MNRPLRALILIPVYNHGATIREVVAKALATGLPVLVVDDGSDQPVQALLAGLDCVVLRHPVNQGKGVALQSGLAWALHEGYDAAISLDGDGQHDPAEAPKLLAPAEAASGPSLIIGSRLMIQASVPRSSSFGRSFSNFWVRLETGQELADTQSGFRLYPVQAINRLRLTKGRYDFEIEVLVKALWAGIPVAEVEVSVHYPPGDERISHFHKLKDNLRLSRLHTLLVLRRLLPWPHQRLIAPGFSPVREKMASKNPLKILRILCQSHSSPLLLAVAVWLGLFMGALPLLACHTVAIIYVCHRLHLNPIAAVAASQFCMPPLVPALCIEVGSFLRNGRFLLDLSWQRWLLEIHQRLWEWLLGSLLVGPLLGVIGGALIYGVADRFRRRKITLQALGKRP